MLSRRRIPLRLALALCAALLLAGPPLPSAAQTTPAAFPEESSLLPFNAVKDAENIAVDAGRVAWIDRQDTLWTLDTPTRQSRAAGPASALSSNLRLRGDTAVWYEADRPWPSSTPPQYRLRGRNLASGASFTVNDGYESLGETLLTMSRVVWTRRVGQNTQILQRRLTPEAQPALLAEISNAEVRQLSQSGPDLTWVEQRGDAPERLSSQISTLNAETGGTPSALVALEGTVGAYTRGPGTLVWSQFPRSGVAGTAPAALFTLDPQGRPLQLDTDVGAFRQIGLEVVAVTSQGLVGYDLLKGTRTLIVAQAAQTARAQSAALAARAQASASVFASGLVLDDDNICWGHGANPRLSCYRRSQHTLAELWPPASSFGMQISDGVLTLVAKGAGPNDPLGAYALPLADLYQRARDSAAFERLWQRLDLPVQQGQAARSWTWGPYPLRSERREPYAEGPGGARTVRYYDKSRMEINNPQADPGSPWYITNGLLPVELISGRLQTGNQSFEQRPPAAVTAVGDPGQFPTYADLAALFQSPGPADPAQQGRPVTRLLTPDGAPAALADFARDPATLAVSLSNGHPVPRAFADFMRQRGPTWQDGRASAGPLYDPLFVFGLPVTPPVWVNVRVGGQTKPVLLQVFERRVLTYTPANPPGFRVEMGNVGQHYFQWRYP